ncbi:hypothetical protein BDR26DRAFT_853328 [Obelidium mucronatum]|nr:hypothetical protein BDR26DRAFT_853328 [Obelidium mucronatum]
MKIEGLDIISVGSLLTLVLFLVGSITVASASPTSRQQHALLALSVAGDILPTITILGHAYLAVLYAASVFTLLISVAL